MNEELQNTVNEMLVGMIDSVTSVKEFVMAELPDVIHQLLMWHMVQSLVATIASLVGLLFLTLMWRKIVKDWSRIEGSSIEPMVVIGSICSTVLIAVFSVIAIFDITWLKILIAPKLYLLEYAAELVR